jgi:4-amino-4-deoxy-L-arabinose transferase-like glycosyltransferase
MIVDTLVCLLLVLGVAFGLSRPVVDRLGLGASERLVAGAALSLLGAWAVAWAVFISGAPLSGYLLVPTLAAAGLLLGRRSAAGIFSDPTARDLAVGQLIVTGWCVAWLSFIKVHTGGAWTGDSFEHWERARFFLRQWPRDRLFIESYILPARPPLANVLTAAFMRVTSVSYANFQVITTALCSLAYLPVGLLAGRFGGRSASRMAAVILMLSPLFVQNATYPWTKLEAVFFILTGFYFFLRVRDRDAATATSGLLCAISLGGAVVTHYSAGPYVVVLAVAWIAIGCARKWDGGFVRLTLVSALAGACVLAPWFIWSVADYGWRGTFLSNSSVSMVQKNPGSPLVAMILNIRDTLLPPQVRGFNGTIFVQTSPWGSLRDNCFLIYQLNPLFALGCVGWLTVLREGFRAARAATRRDRVFWIAIVAGFFLVSFTTYGDRDHYGIGHICLQSLVLLGLAFLASRWEGLGRGWKAALVAGWLVDFTLGIALQIAVENFALDRWFLPGKNLMEVSKTYTLISQENLLEKFIAHVVYFADISPTPPAIVLLLLGAILCLALVRARGTPSLPPSRP